MLNGLYFVRYRLPIPILLAGMVLSACQTSQTSVGSAENRTQSADATPISLENAKRVLADFDQSAFKAPPRSSQDILVSLDQKDTLSGVRNKKLIAEANAKIAKDATQHTRLTSYLSRARAARGLGWNGQEIRDLRAAVAIIDRYDAGENVGFTLGPSFEKVVLRDAAWAEISDGNYNAAIKLFRRAADTVIPDTVPANLHDTGVWKEKFGQALAHANAGDISKAIEIAGLAQNENEHASDCPYRFLKNDDCMPSAIGGARGGSYGGMRAPENPWRRIYPAASKAAILQIEGRWAEAELLIRGTLELYRSEIGDSSALAWAHGRESEWFDLQRAQLALNLIQQGRLLEAEVILREAISAALREKGQTSKITAVLAAAFVELLLEQGRLDEAATLAQRVISIYHQLGVPPDSRLLGEARFLLAASDALRGDWDTAVDEYQAVRDAFSGNKSTFEKFFATNPTLLLTLAKMKPSGEVISQITTAYAKEKANKGSDHYDTIELSAIEAIATVSGAGQGNSVARLGDAVSALIDLESASRDSNTPRLQRRLRLKAIVELYIDAVTPKAGSNGTLNIDPAVVADTFKMASFAQGQSIELALGKSLARQRAGNSELRTLIRNVQDADQRIEASYNLLAKALRPAHSLRDTAVISALRAKVQRLQQSQQTVRADIEKRFPEYASLIKPTPIPLGQVKQYLAREDALVSFYPMDTKTLIWIVPSTGKAVLQVAPLGRKDIDRLVGTLRESLDPNASTLGEIPVFDVKAAHQLYTALLAPNRRIWGKSKNLLVVASGSLGQLPLSVLVTEPTTLPRQSGTLFTRYQKVPWLARSHAITVLPSVTVLASLRQNRQQPGNRLAYAGFGNPRFGARDGTNFAPGVVSTQTRGGQFMRLRSAPATRSSFSAGVADLAPLPDTDEEVRSIGKALNADIKRDVFVGEHASEETIKSLDLSNRKVLVFATHGLLPGDIDGLQQPALALTPTTRGKQVEDGLLTMGEILSLKLNADWVVLSACNTGAADGKGAEAVSGLVRAFFYAGTRALLVSNWPVETTSAKVLTTTLFTLQAKQNGLTRSYALRKAMLQLVDDAGSKDAQGRIVFSYAHPIFWAPFSVVGDGGSDGPVS